MLRKWAAQSSKRPTLVTIITGSTVMFFGDIASQKFEGKEHLDFARLAIGTIWQGCISAPLFNVWFRFLDKSVTAQGFRGALSKVFLNQIISPLPINAGYMAFSSTFEAVARPEPVSPSQVQAEISYKIRHNLLTVVLGSALFWIPMNTLNFAFCPPQYRILPSIFGGVIWGCLFAYYSVSFPFFVL